MGNTSEVEKINAGLYRADCKSRSKNSELVRSFTREVMHMWRSMAFSFLAVALTSQTMKDAPLKPYDVPEAYEVYAAALALDHVEGDEDRELLILNTTAPSNQCLDTHGDKAVASAIEDYKKANSVKWLLERRLRLARTYKLISAEEIDALKIPDRNGGFFWHFPENIRIRSLSAVGFNNDKTLAFVEMDFECGGLCGHGRSFILQKQKGKWIEYSPPPIENPDGSWTFQGTGSCGWGY